MEWQPQFKRGGKENKTALIQICSRDTILLLQVLRLECKPLISLTSIVYSYVLACRFTKSTCPILENKDLTQVGREYQG